VGSVFKLRRNCRSGEPERGPNVGESAIREGGGLQKVEVPRDRAEEEKDYRRGTAKGID